MSAPAKQSTNTDTIIRLFRAVVVLGIIMTLGWWVWQNTQPEATHPFKLGLDLAGGSHLLYEADTSGVDPQDVPELMAVLRDVIERRINVFGVSEPIVQVEQSSFVTDTPIERLVVELPGVTDVSQAIEEIGRTPLLEFKLLDEEILAEQEALLSLNSLQSASGSVANIDNVRVNGEPVTERSPFVDTGLTGRYLEGAALEFAGQATGQLANEPIISVRFTPDGGQLFAQITRDNVGKQLGIFLDGELISAPNINEPIVGGQAVISGGFTPDEARALAQNLNFGALPVPISLVSTQTVGASLGAEVLGKGIQAGAWGLGLIMLFMVVWYRVPGLLAGLSLSAYVIMMLTLFQYIPVTLTAAGLAGFVLSMGMAVDANVLVFERMKEEFRNGLSSRAAAHAGFTRAWSAIRDGNITSLLSAIILFWFGTSVVKGFALVFGIGVILSMVSALIVTRTLLISLPVVTDRSAKGAWLFGTGIKK